MLALYSLTCFQSDSDLFLPFTSFCLLRPESSHTSAFLFAPNRLYHFGLPRGNASSQPMGSFLGLMHLGLTTSPGIQTIHCCGSYKVATALSLSHMALLLPYSVGQLLTRVSPDLERGDTGSTSLWKQCHKICNQDFKTSSQVSRAQAAGICSSSLT